MDLDKQCSKKCPTKAIPTSHVPIVYKKGRLGHSIPLTRR